MLHEQALAADLAALYATWTPASPFPAYRNRAAWAALPEADTRVWVETARDYLSYDWPALRMEYYLNIKRQGETFRGWQAFCKRRALLGTFLIAECVEGQGRFLDQIINGIYAICEETSWIQMMSIRDNDFALPDERDNFVDLCSVETSQLFAWISALMGDALDEECPRIRVRMRDEVLRRVVRPYLDRDDYWWMGFVDTRINNWNPWCNQHMIETIAFLDYPPALRAELLTKLCRSLDIYLDRYAADGACDEGPSYWGAAGMGLGKCAALLKYVTNGAVDGTGIEKLRAICAYFYKVHIDNGWFVNYADGDANLPIGAGVYRLGKMLGDEALTALGRFAPAPTPVLSHWFSIYDYLVALFDAPERRSQPAAAPYVKRAYFDVCQIMVAREQAGSPKGLYLSAKGGNNIESHNHNDVGSFIAFLDGRPLFIDLGTEEYSLKTFSKERFSIWYLQSQYHNAPTIAGALQHDGRDYFATGTRYAADGDGDEISMNLERAYPAGTAVKRWRRTVALRRGGDPRIEIADEYDGLAAPGTCYNFVSHAKPVVRAGTIALDLGDGLAAELTFDGGALAAEIEEIPIEESRLRRNWGDRVWRIVLREKTLVPRAKRTFAIRRA
ncbi:MAG: hypothetical protein GX558_04490 [Clostridiales bacterium]|nr:hypothetical protein [Clostridiales bacterium]